MLLRCDNTNLYDRLKERGYNENKINENIECEIFGVLAIEVAESYQPEIIMELNSGKIEDIESNLQTVIQRIKEII